jgi:hypothetical protein
MARSVEEIFEDMGKILREGIANGAIHLNPPSKNFMKNHSECFSTILQEKAKEKQEPPTMEIRLERVEQPHSSRASGGRDAAKMVQARERDQREASSETSRSTPNS